MTKAVSHQMLARLERLGLSACVWIGIVLIGVPMLLTVYLSVFDEKLILFPPRGYTLRGIGAIWPNFGGAVAITSLSSRMASVVGSLLLGVRRASRLSRYRLRGIGVVSALLLAPLTVPGIALGLGDLPVPGADRDRDRLGR